MSIHPPISLARSSLNCLPPFQFFSQTFGCAISPHLPGIQPLAPSRRVTLVPSVWILRFAPWNRKPRPSNCSISAKRCWSDSLVRFPGDFHHQKKMSEETTTISWKILTKTWVWCFSLSYWSLRFFFWESCPFGKDQFLKIAGSVGTTKTSHNWLAIEKKLVEHSLPTPQLVCQLAIARPGKATKHFSTIVLREKLVKFYCGDVA